MAQADKIKIIARINSVFSEKFGIPRQSGLVSSLKAQIIFEEEYRNLDAVRGLDEFSHLWIIWQFSKAVRDTWSPTVRPPRLGGNKRIGVFATRSPFRPNAIGLSSVKIEKIDLDGVDVKVEVGLKDIEIIDNGEYRSNWSVLRERSTFD